MIISFIIVLLFGNNIRKSNYINSIVKRKPIDLFLKSITVSTDEELDYKFNLESNLLEEVDNESILEN